MGGRGASSSKNATHGSSGGGGRDNTSFNTHEQVRKLNDLLESAKDGSRREIRDALENIQEGQKITVYRPERLSNGKYVEGLINQPTTWTKKDDGTWASNDGRRIDNSDMTRRLYNGGATVRVGGGEISTENRTEVTGRLGKDYNGLRYAKGNYDIQKTQGNNGRIKESTSGQITTYNGTQYGVKKIRGGYGVTHIPTGMSISYGADLNTLNDVSNYIKKMDGRISGMKNLKGMVDEFNKTRRGD